MNILKKLAVTNQPIHELLASRWSCMAFDPNKKVSGEQIISICEAGRWAPSCNGDEPWRFIVWDRNHDATAFEKAFNSLTDRNKLWVKNVPVLIASCADSKFRNGRDNLWGKFDTGAACENIYLQAVALGLMAHPMGGFSQVKLREEFQIPEQFEIMAMIAIGYQADSGILDDERQRNNELKERTRQPLETEFFDSAWGNEIIQ
jgi:nitroreductase